MNNTFLQARLTATQEQIVAFENAACDLANGNIESYTLDTGQSRQTVTKLNLSTLNKVIDSLYNRCVTLENRLNGGSVIIARPAF